MQPNSNQPQNYNANVQDSNSQPQAPVIAQSESVSTEQMPIPPRFPTSNQLRVRQSTNPINGQAKFKKAGIITLIIIAFFAIAGAVGYFVWQSANKDKIAQYEKMLIEADEFYRSRRYSASLQKLNDAVDLFPSRNAAYRKSIDILVEKGLLSEASEVLIASENRFTKAEFAQLWGIIGKAYYDNGLYDNALKSLQLSYDAKKDTDYTTYYVKALLANGNLTDAEDALSNSKDKNLATNWNLYKTAKDKTDLSLYDRTKTAKTLLANGYPYLTIDLYDGKSSEIEEYWDAQYLIGSAYYQLGDEQKALDYFEAALALGANDYNISILTARTQLKLANVDSAITYYDRTLAFADGIAVQQIVQEYLTMLWDESLFIKANSVLEMYAETADLDWQYLEYKNAILSENEEDASSLQSRIDAQLPDSTWEFWYDYMELKVNALISESDYDGATTLTKLIEAEDKYSPFVQIAYAEIALAQDKTEGVSDMLYKALDYDTTGKYSVKARSLLNQL